MWLCSSSSSWELWDACPEGLGVISAGEEMGKVIDAVWLATLVKIQKKVGWNIFSIQKSLKITCCTADRVTVVFFYVFFSCWFDPRLLGLVGFFSLLSSIKSLVAFNCDPEASSGLCPRNQTVVANQVLPTHSAARVTSAERLTAINAK